MSLNHDDQRRFSRQIMLAEIGEDGQKKLATSSVLVIGVGGLGAPLITYLASCGVGHIGIIDHDHVELSNLHRQITFEQGDINRLKVEAAADRLSELAPDCRVDIYPQRLRDENVSSILRNYDVIADGCDNFATRFIVQEACLALKKPLISAAVSGWKGYVSTFVAHEPNQPCYRCLIPELPPEAQNCTETGIVGSVAGVVGTMQATETIKTSYASG